MVYQKSDKQNIFEELRLGIMKGVFTPRERLVERELAKRYGVSRTPIREAIHRLEELGLVQIVANQGARVTSFSFQDINNLYDTRILLEQHAAKLACSYISSREIVSLTNINEKLSQSVFCVDFSKMIKYDQQFHLTLYKYSRNPFLVKMIEDFRVKSYPISYFFWKSNVDLKKSISEHREIIKLLKNKNKRKLKLLIEQNLIKAKIRYSKFLSDI
jgi:DNA-binding GntR family transcriptional regulator